MPDPGSCRSQRLPDPAHLRQACRLDRIQLVTVRDSEVIERICIKFPEPIGQPSVIASLAKLAVHAPGATAQQLIRD